MAKKETVEEIVVETKIPVVLPITEVFALDSLNALRDKINEIISKL